MIKLEQLQPNAAIRGITPDALVTVVSVQWFGDNALELTYKTPAGKNYNFAELLARAEKMGVLRGDAEGTEKSI